MKSELSLELTGDNFVYILWKKFRSELLARPGFVFGVLVALLLLAALFYWPIRIARYGKLTDLDQVLFQLFLVTLSGAISWVLAKRQEERNVLAKQKALANSAVRRIASIASAAIRLGEVIEARKIEARSSSDWSEMEATHRSLLFELFDGLSRQVVEMRDNIEASVGDWRDILPEEFARKQQAETEILKAREAAIQQKQKALEELQQALARGESRTAEQISALREAFAKQLEAATQNLSLRVEEIRSRLPSTVVPSGMLTWATTPSRIVYGDGTVYNTPTIGTFVDGALPIFQEAAGLPQSSVVRDPTKVAAVKAAIDTRKAQEKAAENAEHSDTEKK